MSKVRFIGAVCLCCMLFATLVSGKTTETEHGLYKKAVTTARSEIWQAINSGRCGSATAAITVNGKVVYARRLWHGK